MRLLGAILAGGAARRFGSDKAMAMLHGQPLLQHVQSGLQPHVAALVVCGRSWSGAISLADRPAPDLGPLGGLCAALHHAQKNSFDGVLSAGCDVLPVPDLQPLCGSRAAVIEGHYLFGFWPVSLAPVLEQHLLHINDRSLRSWMALCGARQVKSDTALFNLNTQAEFLRYAQDKGMAA